MANGIFLGSSAKFIKKIPNFAGLNGYFNADTGPIREAYDDAKPDGSFPAIMGYRDDYSGCALKCGNVPLLTRATPDSFALKRQGFSHSFPRVLFKSKRKNGRLFTMHVDSLGNFVIILRRCYTGQLATPTCNDTMLREKMF